MKICVKNTYNSFSQKKKKKLIIQKMCLIPWVCLDRTYFAETEN